MAKRPPIEAFDASRDLEEWFLRLLLHASSTAAAPDTKGKTAENKDLVERLKQDDPRAKRELFERFGREINRVVGNVLGVNRDHDDVVQEVFVRILRNVHQLRDPDALRAWVVSVSVNTVRTHIKRIAFRRALGLQSHETIDIPWNDDHDQLELVYSVQGLLNKLPTEERLALLLRHVEGHSIDELSTILDISPATVKRRIAKAKQRFLALVQHHPVLAAEMAALQGNG